MLKFKTVTDEKECRNLWEEFSPNEILWDLWEFRICFHRGSSSFKFFLGYDGPNNLGLIPLVYDDEFETYTYFGDTFPEQNKFFLKDKKDMKLFLDKLPENVQIFYIDGAEAKFYQFKSGDKRYFLDLEKYKSSYENYLESFTKKHRKNLRYDLNKLERNGFSVEKNKIDDFDILVSFNKERFGKDSDYNEQDFADSMKKLIANSNNKNMLDLISIKIENNTEGVGLGVYYKDIYYVLGVGRNPGVNNLGKLLIAEQIKSAISLKCIKVDFLSTESGWKELWNLDSEEMYEFEN
jgi:hypothetical protein